MTKHDLALAAEAASGLSFEKCAEVVGFIFDVIGQHYANHEAVTIEGFGRFGPAYANRTRKRTWKPAQAMRERMTPSVPVAGLVWPYKRPQGQAPRPKPAPRPLRTPPVSSVDAHIINEWVASQMSQNGTTSEPVTEATIYQGPSGKPRMWGPVTCTNAKSILRSFARRCQVPIATVGMVNGKYDVSAGRQVIIAYAQYYEASRVHALAQYVKSAEAIYQAQRGPIIWRTPKWQFFIRYGTDFYSWLERRGLRPPKSNPFTDIQKFSMLCFTKGARVVVTKWYEAILAYPHTAPQHGAIIHLLANGLRASEVASIKCEGLSLTNRTVDVLGKGSKHRTVVLHSTTIAALERYLATRTTSASPWLFPTQGGRHIDPSDPWPIVRHVTKRVFPRPEDHARVVKHISPHGFRNFYASKYIRAGVPEIVVQTQLGHTSNAMTRRYTHVDPAWVEKEIRAFENRSKARQRGGHIDLDVRAEKSL